MQEVKINPDTFLKNFSSQDKQIISKLNELIVKKIRLNGPIVLEGEFYKRKNSLVLAYGIHLNKEKGNWFVVGILKEDRNIGICVNGTYKRNVYLTEKNSEFLGASGKKIKVDGPIILVQKIQDVNLVVLETIIIESANQLL